MELDVFHLFLWEPIAFENTPFEVNRVVLLMYLAAAVCCVFFVWGASRASVKPKGIGMVVETGYTFVKNQIAIDVMGPDGARYTPLLATMFFFIFFSNLFEIVPGINFPVTSRMALPAVLALTSWVIFNAVGFKRHGFGYIKNVLFPPGVPKPIYIILTPLEFFSTILLRPFTLAIRLFANMLAGHVLLTVFFLFTEELLQAGIAGASLSIVTFLTACVLIVFELMVITVQAYIFTTLTAFYIAEALHGHGDEPHEDTEHVTTEHETEGLADARAA